MVFHYSLGMGFWYGKQILCSQSDSEAVWITFSNSQWLVVNHGQALKKDQVLARKQFLQNMIICLISSPIQQLFSPAKTNRFYTIAQFCLFWRKTTMSVVGGSLFQRALDRMCTSYLVCSNNSESDKTIQNTQVGLCPVCWRPTKFFWLVLGR